MSWRTQTTNSDATENQSCRVEAVFSLLKYIMWLLVLFGSRWCQAEFYPQSTWKQDIKDMEYDMLCSSYS